MNLNSQEQNNVGANVGKFRGQERVTESSHKLKPQSARIELRWATTTV